MAGDGGYSYRRVDGWLTEKVQAQLGVLGVSAEQRAVDRLGFARSRLRAHLPPALPRVSQHSRRDEESQPGLIRSYRATGAPELSAALCRGT